MILVRHAHLSRMPQEDHEADEAAGVDGVDLAEIVEEAALLSCVAMVRSPYLVFVDAEFFVDLVLRARVPEDRTTKTISEPCAAM